MTSEISMVIMRVTGMIAYIQHQFQIMYKCSIKQEKNVTNKIDQLQTILDTSDTIASHLAHGTA